MIMISSNFIFKFINFCVIVSFFVYVVLLYVIDIFSKYAWVIILKRKKHFKRILLQSK